MRFKKSFRRRGSAFKRRSSRSRRSSRKLTPTEFHAVALECRIMRKFKNAAKLTSSADMEVNTQVSCTVPDQSLSIREILIRYANGTISDISLNNELVYSEDMPDLRGIDISELQQLKKRSSSRCKRY